MSDVITESQISETRPLGFVSEICFAFDSHSCVAILTLEQSSTQWLYILVD